MNNTVLLNEIAVRPNTAPGFWPLAYSIASLAARANATKEPREHKDNVPIWAKYSLTITEAAEYYGIGEKRLRSIIAENPNADFVLEIGTHIRIKRKLFEDYLDQAMAV